MSYQYVLQPTSTRFMIPRTLASDFDEFLLNDIPGSVGDFKLYKDWYNQSDFTTIRGQLYPDTTKSRYSDTDNNLNFRASVNSGIIKGDMIVDSDGVVYLLDWQVAPSPNNRSTRAVRCNAKTTFKRYVSQTTDDRGFLITEQGYNDIAQDILFNSYRYDGRPQFSATSGNPGITSEALTISIIQYNSKTKQICVNDVFQWGKDTFIVVDIDYTGINIDGTSGIMRIQSKKKPGGIVG